MGAILALLAASSAPCTLPPGWNAVAARKTPYVIFGETHGTLQAPEFVGNVVCALARQKKRVLLALEISSKEDADLQAAWRPPTDRVASSLVETVRDWDPDYAGCPMSQATLDMLVELHRQKARGAKIDVVAFTVRETEHRWKSSKPKQAKVLTKPRRRRVSASPQHVADTTM